MGATRSNAGSYSTGMVSPATQEKSEKQSQMMASGVSTGYEPGSYQSDKSAVSPSSYLERTRETASGTPSDTSYVGEMRRAGSQAFGQALGIKMPTESEEDEGGVAPTKISGSRMAGDILGQLSVGSEDELDPTKKVNSSINDLKYGIGGGASQPVSPYTSAFR